ncbi:DNA methyltransferase [Streptomyces viridochromogenes]|uniref:Cytosine-specific methyltransferase n=1 Tax=Streptomyces viridochromogenes TaxID=1938 RepID=A0A0J8C3M7_STRVR|nr:DNA (cytosine-5-)-methyltransferase [Streptomyces viridochromogenes]KMS72410.1 DNA methyltransferase [Streptomyces viridochromogenes]KOG06988.1 DNA methyltransferase [Streptomyces viridochromogenes]KOG08301.1 DNA methyltransferase [Streptomyces viridochromogenes]
MTRMNEPEGAIALSEDEFTSIEICAGAGGQAIGLHGAGFRHLALVEIDKYAAATLRENIEVHPKWDWERDNCDVLCKDVVGFEPEQDLKKSAAFYRRGEVDLLAGGVPCPPFSHAGKQLGEDDERDLFPRILELAELIRPRAVMIENVRGLMDAKFDDYRSRIQASLEEMEPTDDGFPGYEVVGWKVYEAEKFGVPQLRPRSILVAFRKDILRDLKYEAPAPSAERVSVFKALEETMLERIRPFEKGPRAAQARQVFDDWKQAADKDVAPTLVGGSKKHGGADLGPSRAKKAWRDLGVSGMGVANAPVDGKPTGTEDRDLFGSGGPMLTVRQAAIIQGFPTGWDFSGGKTAQYRQVGNAFPPPVAQAIGESIIDVLRAARERDRRAD